MVGLAAELCRRPVPETCRGGSGSAQPTTIYSDILLSILYTFSTLILREVFRHWKEGSYDSSRNTTKPNPDLQQMSKDRSLGKGLHGPS
ncbi:hypothetical protein WJX75_001540 [Coccomyxa subellipsoidea]|uniref:Uncharacterized protein n=1 Tax=Coccomyxa subellipsoidea TaxID=248742 RepID=A0ABR2YVN5_9CHLO